MIIRALRAVPGKEEKNTDKQINADTCNDPITNCYITHSRITHLSRSACFFFLIIYYYYHSIPLGSWNAGIHLKCGVCNDDDWFMCHRITLLRSFERRYVNRINYRRRHMIIVSKLLQCVRFSFVSFCTTTWPLRPDV